MLNFNDPSFLAYFSSTSVSDDQAALQPLVDLLLDIYYPSSEGDMVSCESADFQLIDWDNNNDDDDALDNLRLWEEVSQAKDNDSLQLECWVNNLDVDSDDTDVPGSLVLVNTQVADDDCLNKELSRIEDREYFFNDLLNCISVELQELEAWVNNLLSEVNSPENKDSQLNDWVNNQSGAKTLSTTHHYRVRYGGKMNAELVLVGGRYVSKFNLTSGGTSYKSPYNFHGCLSKQPKNAPSLQT